MEENYPCFGPFLFSQPSIYPQPQQLELITMVNVTGSEIKKKKKKQGGRLNQSLTSEGGPPAADSGRKADEHMGGGSDLVTKLCLTLATPWFVAHQAPLPMGFPR